MGKTKLTNYTLRTMILEKLFKRGTSTNGSQESRQSYDVIFHIGAPKTGSSAIQKFLLENRHNLNRLGYYYPEHGLDENGISGGQSILGLDIAHDKPGNARPLLESWHAQACRRGLTLLISAESLFNHPEKLKNLTGDLRCKILSFYRDPVEAIYSNYNQSIKRHFITATFQQTCERILKTEPDFYTGRIFARWADCFGNENVVLMAYDLDLYDQTPIQATFLSMLGAPEDAIKRLTPDNISYVNRSYSPGALELKRLLNHVLDISNKKQNDKIDLLLQKHSDAIQHTTPDMGTLLDANTYTMLTEKFRHSMQHAVRGLIGTTELLQRNTRSHAKKHSMHNSDIYKEMFDLVNALRKTNPDLFEYIHKQTLRAIEAHTMTYSHLKLAEIINLPIPSSHLREAWFTNRQLKIMASGKYQEVHYLRDIAQLLLERREYQSAYSLALQAKKLRPKEPNILKLVEEIECRLNETS
ncbi:MAG: hypothetical protein R3F42_06675 [Pseudomonadota bacterium]